MSGKPAYVTPIRSLVASTYRAPEQIKGCLLRVYVENLKCGKDKCVALIVDKDKKHPLKSVLVCEAWSPVDQKHTLRYLKPLKKKIISLTNAKIQTKGKTMVYFDAAVKWSWDSKTEVKEAAEDEEYPRQLPELPDIKAAASLKAACMISTQAVVTETGSAVPRNVPGGVSKLVANLKVATGKKDMAAAFWEDLAQQMGEASTGQVYRLDWMILKPEGAGKCSLGSTAMSSVALLEGDTASAVGNNLAVATDRETMSATYGQSRKDKMKKAPCHSDLFTLETIQSLQLGTPGVVLVPAMYAVDVRGMAAEMSSRAWYTGCAHCKKQMEQVGNKMQCPEHGENKGKRVFGGQMLFADPSYKKELAVWEETLRHMAKEFLGTPIWTRRISWMT